MAQVIQAVRRSCQRNFCSRRLVVRQAATLTHPRRTLLRFLFFGVFCSLNLLAPANAGASPSARRASTSSAVAAAVVSPWHAKCLDPRNATRKISDFHDNSIKGIFCGPIVDHLGLGKGLNEESCHNLRGKLNDDGLCKIVIKFHDIVHKSPLFCLGAPDEPRVVVRLLIKEHTASDNYSVFDYEWNVVGQEWCTIWKMTHLIPAGISSVVDRELKGGTDDDPAALKSTSALQELFLSSWALLTKEPPHLEWKCIVHPMDEK